MTYLRRRKNRFLITFLTLLFIVGGITYFLFHAKGVKADWFDQNWHYRQAITLTVTSSSSDVTDLDTWFSMNTSTAITAGKMKGNCDDLRFTSATGKPIPYFINSGCNSAATKIWVRVDLIPKNSTQYTLYAYYGNPSAPAGSNSYKFSLYNGLVGYWPMNESSWTNNCAAASILDFSVNGFNGTSCPASTGSTGGATGKYGYAGSFDGSDDFVSIADNAALRVAESAGAGGTYTFWFNRLTYTPAGDDYIIGKNGTMAGYVDSSTYILGDIYLQGGTDFNGDPNMTASQNTWYFIALTTTGTAQALYVNGVLKDSAAINDWIDTSSGEPLIIGTEGTENHFHGSIDDVRIYNRALSGGEITKLYNSTDSILYAPKGQVIPTTSFGLEEIGPGPVGYWKFDEGQGQTAYDESSYGNNGTLGSGTGSDTYDPTWQTEDLCVAGKCLKFDGSNDYVNMGSSSRLEMGTDDMTVSVWVKTTTSSNMSILYKGAGGPTEEGYWLWYNPANDDLEFDLGDNSTRLVADSNNNLDINDGNWHHIVVSLDRDSNATFYKDGINVGTYNISSWNTYTIDNADGINFYIGHPTSMFLNGFVDDVRIYKYVRNSDQIKAEYNAGKNAAKGDVGAAFGAKAQEWMNRGLVGYWKQDEATWSGTLNEVVDSSGNANHGTAAGAAGGKAYPTSAKFGNGGYFEKVDNYVSVADSSSLRVGESAGTGATYSMWVKANSLPAVSGSSIIMKKDGIAPYIYNNAGTGTITVNVFYNSASAWYATSNFNITLATWYFVTVTHDGTTSKLYINGEMKTSNVANDYLTSSSGDTLYFGREFSGNYLGGVVDDVRIYSRALSPKEVSDLYNWAPGPVGWWKFDEAPGSGNTIVDSSGYGNNGLASLWGGSNISTDSARAVGKYGKAFKFDGLDDYIDAGASTNLAFSGSITVEGWINPRAWNKMIFSRYRTDFSTYAYGWDLEIWNDGELAFYYANGGSTRESFESGSEKISLNQWTHVAVTLDGTNSKMYYNGILVEQAAQPIQLVAATATSACSAWNLSGYLCFGYYGGKFWNGLMDDLRIYNYARTQKQILEDMNAGHPAVGSPLGSYVGYWKFDEGYGTTAYDNSINHNDGTLSGAVWNNNGKFGKALSFNGTSSYVNAGTGVSLDGTVDMTISFWYNFPSDYTTGDVVSRTTSQYEIYSDTSDHAFSSYWGTAYTQTDLPVRVNTWTHVVYVKTGTNIKIYENGRLVKDSTLVGTPSYSGSYDLDIGKRSTAANYIKGLLDEVKIYPFALTADDVKAEYNQGKSLVLGSFSDTSGLTGGSVASNSASALYCIPGDTATCNPPYREWKMDEYSGTSIQDTSGNGITGTLGEGTATYRPVWSSSGGCHSGSCLQFDGVNDYVDMGNTDIIPQGSFTVEGWLNPGSVPPDPTGPGSERYWISQNDNWIGVANDTGVGYISAWFTAPIGGSGLYVYNPTPYALNTWYHVAVTYNYATGYLYMYVNGSQVSSANGTSGNIQASSNNNYIGKIYSTPQYFPFKSDAVTIFNYVRTPAQIAWDYNRGKPVGYWKFDECQGLTANDVSGNGNTGTITIGATGAQTTIGTCNTPIDSTGAWFNGKAGKYSSAMSFDGTDDYVTIPDSSILRVGQSAGTGATYEMWFKLISLPGASSGVIMAKGGSGAIVPYVETVSGVGYFGADVHYNGGTHWYYGTYGGSNRTANVGQWNHFVITHDGTTTRIYINGILDDDNVASNYLLSTSTSPLTIGQYTTSNYFPGLVDDVKVFNYALTPAQVKMDYNQGAAVRFAPWTCGDDVKFTYSGSTITYGSVSSLGECWLDRNLGASRIATAYNDSNAYGDYFQWGRLVDGHQLSGSLTTNTRATTDVPGHSRFIYYNSSPYDWRNPQNDNLWQGVSGTNNPCPSGWRVPTNSEWSTEEASWGTQSRVGAFASPLKLTAAGGRNYGDASWDAVGSEGLYWSSTVNSTYADTLYFTSSTSAPDSSNRAYGLPIRCIKD